MDLRNADREIQTREMVERALMRLNTAIPGYIQSFDSAKQTVKATPAIKMRTMIDGNEAFVTLPEILEVPLIYPMASTAGFAFTLPVRAGDPCLLFFSQRAIDNWHDRGGIQPPDVTGAGSRHHDLTDAFALLAPVPIPYVLSSWEGNGIELRNRAKNSRLTLRDDEIEIQCTDSIVVINADGTITIDSTASVTVTTPQTTINGAVTINGTELVTGTIESETSVADPNGTMQEMRNLYNTHTHPAGGVPSPQMD